MITAIARRRRVTSRASARAGGFSSVLACLYVAMFSSLAIAYTAVSNTTAELSGNTLAEQRATAAAESGLSILRYHIASLSFDGDASADDVFAAIGDHLAGTFNDTLNLPAGGVEATAEHIHLPAVPLGGVGGTFEADITRGETDYILTVHGDYHGVGRSVSVQFTEQNGPANSGILSNGVVSRGSIHFNGSVVLRSNIPGGSAVMSLDPDALRPISVNGSGRYDGDFYTLKEGVTSGDIFNGSHQFLNPETGAYESALADHVHAGIDEPAWPTVNTEKFQTLINALPHTVIDSHTNLNGTTSLHNVLIRANADPRFNGTVTITGLVYVEWPNDVRFNGSLNITGMIVCAKPPYEPGVDDTPTNTMLFNGSISSHGVESLPDTAEYAGLRSETGTFLLAPDYEVTTNGALGTVNGTIYTSALRMNGSTSGTVRGSIIVDRRRELLKNGSVNLYFEQNPDYATPAGLEFETTKSLKMVVATYQET